jgi:hypothetical protein
MNNNNENEHLDPNLPFGSTVSVLNSINNKLININKESLKEEEKENKEKEEDKDSLIEKNTKTRLKDYILTYNGIFNIDDVMRDLNLSGDKRNAVKCALSDFFHQGIIERKGSRSGMYSPIKGRGIYMNDLIRSASTDPVTIGLPLAIDALLNIYNRNLIIIQGLSNAGKTAFLMEIARLNRRNFDIIKYINSEMDASEIKGRIEKRHMDIEDILSFVSFYLVRSTHESGAIQYEIEPDGLNLVDYLHLEDATLMTTEIDRIQERLDKGIAVVAIQKYLGKDMGYGGSGVKNRARLVIDLSKDIVTLKKVKSPKFWHKEIRLDDAYRKFEYDKDGSIKPKSMWFTEDDKSFRVYTNGLVWENSPVPVPDDDDEFVKED